MCILVWHGRSRLCQSKKFVCINGANEATYISGCWQHENFSYCIPLPQCIEHIFSIRFGLGYLCSCVIKGFSHTDVEYTHLGHMEHTVFHLFPISGTTRNFQWSKRQYECLTVHPYSPYQRSPMIIQKDKWIRVILIISDSYTHSYVFKYAPSTHN